MSNSLKNIVDQALRKAEYLNGDGIGANECRAALGRLDKIISPSGHRFVDDDVEQRVIALLMDTIRMARDEGFRGSFLADELEDLVSKIKNILYHGVSV